MDARIEPAHENLYLNHVYDIMCDLTFEDDEKVAFRRPACKPPTTGEAYVHEATTVGLDRKPTAIRHFLYEVELVVVCFLGFWTEQKFRGSPVFGNAVVIAVTLAIGEKGSRIAYFSHSAGAARAQRTVRPPKTTPCLTSRD